jgi:two-component system, OmpR family, response regulator BaeR
MGWSGRRGSSATGLPSLLGTGSVAISMPRVLIASDAPWLRAQVRGRIQDQNTEVLEVERGAAVLPVVRDLSPDLVILDFQIGNMGAPAVCRELRSEADSGRLPRVPVLILLDRSADVFLSRRADADAWLQKPVPPRALQRTIDLLLSGRTTWSPEAVGIRPAPLT